MAMSLINPKRFGLPLLYIIVGLLYVAYIAFIIAGNQSGVDYETFMQIGDRFRTGQPVWTENSYYPMPYVMIFGLFSALPRPISMFIWHSAAIILALYITRGKPWPLLFAPLLAHTIGGQTAFFGLLGLYIYRQNRERWQGGIGLAILLFKPQLAIFPLIWAGLNWLDELRRQRRLPLQSIVFIIGALLIFVPGFLIIPDWVQQWLAQPRPLFVRAMAGIVPRSLFIVFNGQNSLYWVLLITSAIILFTVVFAAYRRKLPFDVFMMCSYVINPLVHDYDLIQMIAVLERPAYWWAAVLGSIPTWLVIFFAYGNDSAWYAVTLIAPVVLMVMLRYRNQPQEVNLQAILTKKVLL
ncbi:MAG: hypothetical protein IT321_14600 [Anaerolineae bacterium]|nr:hypothetical protein [Anaerolineae bacterium]